MKKIKVFLTLAVLVAAISAFAVNVQVDPCDSLPKYGKIDYSKPDTDPTAFKLTSTITSWTCDVSNTFCLYYFDQATQTFKPCLTNNTNKRFRIVVP